MISRLVCLVESSANFIVFIISQSIHIVHALLVVIVPCVGVASSLMILMHRPSAMHVVEGGWMGAWECH